MLNAIDEGRFSFEELKDKLAEGEHAPSTRSLRRYLSVLSEAGFPWYFDRGTNTYRFADGYSLKRLELNQSELLGLVALRSLGASLGGSIRTYVDDVTDKLLGSAGRGTQGQAVAPSSLVFRLSEIRLDEQGEKAFALLSQAERTSRAVRFAYVDKEGRPTERRVDPYGFIVSGGRVYLVGFDHTRKDKRVFAVDNVRDADVLATTFVKPTDFNIEAFAASSISGVMHSDKTSAVRVRFNSRIAKAAIAARVVSERAIERHDDGSVDITYHVGDPDELLRWVLGWGAQAEIVTPQNLRERMLDLVTQIEEVYRRDRLAALRQESA